MVNPPFKLLQFQLQRSYLHGQREYYYERRYIIHIENEIDKARMGVGHNGKTVF